jgi:hypothetical protein
MDFDNQENKDLFGSSTGAERATFLSVSMVISTILVMQRSHFFF